MKKLSKLKLNQLIDSQLNEREMNILRGTGSCSCACAYANSGGSSTANNSSANSAQGLSSPGTGGGSTNGYPECSVNRASECGPPY